MLSRLLLAASLLCSVAAVAAATVPQALQPPPGAVPVARSAATGAQVYVCTAKEGVLAWSFKAPQAKLVDADGKPFAHHFAGPTWAATDGSKVVGTVIVTSPAPRPDAVAWLLLSAKPTGSGILGDVHFVQRIDTVGGNPPGDACANAGEETAVPYTATYVFFK